VGDFDPPLPAELQAHHVTPALIGREAPPFGMARPHQVLPAGASMTFKPMQMRRCAGPPWSTTARLGGRCRSGVPHPGGGSGQRRPQRRRLEAWRWATASPAVRGPGDPLQRPSARSRAGSAAAERSQAGRQPVPDRPLARGARDGDASLVASVRLEEAAARRGARQRRRASTGGAGTAWRAVRPGRRGRLFKRAAPEGRPGSPDSSPGVSRDAWDERMPELQLRLFGALHLLDSWQASGNPSPPSPRCGWTRTAGSRCSRTTDRSAGSAPRLERHLAQAAAARAGARGAGPPRRTRVADRSGQPGAPRPGRRHPGRQEVADHGAEKGEIVVGLDIGTTKICCIVGEVTPTGST